jgi:hypothetical protein
MSEFSVQMLSPERVVSTVLRQLNQGQIEDATACFATDLRYKDHGIGLEFMDKERVTEFFRKARELYPDYFVQANQTFVSGEHVITQWTLQVTVSEPFYVGLAPEHPYPAANEDAWASLKWVAEHGSKVGIDPQYLAVGGDSSGGLLAAWVVTEMHSSSRSRDKGILPYSCSSGLKASEGDCLGGFPA